MLNGKSVLITGGTGSFGKAFSSYVLKKYPGIKRLVIFSRDELKQFEMSVTDPFQNDNRIRFFIGDIRDKNRLKMALSGIDTVIHAAALKQVPAAEYNPFECIKTNIMGAQNLIEAVLDSEVTRVVALSTDKAAAPVNLYGATKLASDKLFTAANMIRGNRNLKFSVVRYGNVLGSRGSVIPFFLSMKEKGFLPITDPKMTRFNISLDEGVDMVLWAAEHMTGGEIFVPKIPSYNIMDVANAICEKCDKPIIGIRPGEKLHEEMITASDAHYTADLGKYYAILPSYFDESQIDEYLADRNALRVSLPNGYSSDDNPDFLSQDQLTQMIKKYAANEQ